MSQLFLLRASTLGIFNFNSVPSCFFGMYFRKLLLVTNQVGGKVPLLLPVRLAYVFMKIKAAHDEDSLFPLLSYATTAPHSKVIREGLGWLMRPQHHQHAENSALFFTEINGNSITAFSSASWQAGWWNNVLCFSESCLQINLCRQGTALSAQASRAVAQAGVGSNYWDGPSAHVKLFCSLWIFVSAFVPSSHRADRACYHLGQT